MLVSDFMGDASMHLQGDMLRGILRMGRWGRLQDLAALV